MEYVLIIIFVILIIYFIFLKYGDIVTFKSDLDDKYYVIRRGNKDEKYLKESVNILSEINKRIEKLINHLDMNFKNSSKYYFIKKLKDNYSSSVLSEAAIDSRYTTYTINKQEMHICLRTRDINEDIYDINLLMYVVLHELAHLCNYDKNGYPIQGHGEEFRMIFKFLLTESIKIGIYEYENYNKSPKEYCGIQISTSII
jgi:signal peptidase I